jgi:LacI family transcriptional regulator
MRTRQPNLRELAAEAGVSVATVSRILNRGEGDLFAPETVKRVFETAEKMAYRPNLLMRAVLTGRTKTIGVLVPNKDRFYTDIIRGIHDKLIEQDYALMLSWNDEDMPMPDSQRELDLIHRMIDRRVDGIILRPTHDNVSDMYFNEVWERDIPLVTVDRDLSSVHCDFAGTDDVAGGRVAAEHLLELGHRRLGHLAAPASVSTGRDRRQGFEQAIAEFDEEAHCLTIGTKGFHRVYSEAMKLLAITPRVTAVFCASDRAAMEVYKAAADSGLRIPEDLSVVGFADLPVAEMLKPGLTTIRQLPEQIGAEAARLLLARLEGELTEEEPCKTRLIPELILRESTASPKPA